MTRPRRETDPRVALLLTLAATALAVTTPRGGWPDLALWAVVPVALAVWVHLPLHLALHRLAHAGPPLVLIALTVPLSVPGEPVLSLGWGLTVTREGLTLAGEIVVKALIAIALLVCLTWAVPPPRLLAALRGVGCPAPVISVLTVAQRQVGVIVAEWRRTRRAAASRSPAPALSGRAARTLATMAAVLLARSLDRAERIHRAMAARGFTGEVAVQAPLGPMAAHDWVALAMGLTGLAALRVAGALLG